jgi:homospermidine synthase
MFSNLGAKILMRFTIRGKITESLFALMMDGSSLFDRSPYGLWEEACKHAEMAWYGPGPDGWEKDTHLIVHKDKAGYEMCLQSVTPKWTSQTSWELAPYWGFIVTHGEVETISHRLGKQIKCAFVYHTCPDANESMVKAGHKHSASYLMMEGSDVVNTETHVSADNIGALVITKQRKAWWCGSLCKATDAQRAGGNRNNGANLTVSAACLASVAWALEHPNRGCLFPDDWTLEESEHILRLSEPFLGTLVSVAVPDHLVPPIEQIPRSVNFGALPSEDELKH